MVLWYIWYTTRYASLGLIIINILTIYYIENERLWKTRRWREKKNIIIFLVWCSMRHVAHALMSKSAACDARVSVFFWLLFESIFFCLSQIEFNTNCWHVFGIKQNGGDFAAQRWIIRFFIIRIWTFAQGSMWYRILHWCVLQMAHEIVTPFLYILHVSYLPSVQHLNYGNISLTLHLSPLNSRIKKKKKRRTQSANRTHRLCERFFLLCVFNFGEHEPWPHVSRLCRVFDNNTPRLFQPSNRTQLFYIHLFGIQPKSVWLAFN